MITPNWHCVSEPSDLFDLVRTEDIASLNAEFPVERIKLIATDGATNYMRKRLTLWRMTLLPNGWIITSQSMNGRI